MFDPSMPDQPLLGIDQLSTDLTTADGVVHVLDRVAFHVMRGETVGIVGESGCGKSMTARSILRVLPRPLDRLTSGVVMFQGEDLRQVSEATMRKLRGARISMIFQDPMSHLDPSMRIGQQIAEVIRVHNQAGKDGMTAAVHAALASAHIDEVERVAAAYPHQLSGGLRQRALIAMALACNPDLLIADEPTTALDVTTQHQILLLLKKLTRERGMGLILITHDLGVVANMCDRLYVMYAGQVVEHAPVFDFFERPRHPYSYALLQSLRSMSEGQGERLQVIPGTVPSLLAPPDGCRFRARCPRAIARCASEDPQHLRDLSAPQAAACWNPVTDHSEVADVRSSA